MARPAPSFGGYQNVGTAPAATWENIGESRGALGSTPGDAGTTIPRLAWFS
jgi:hypothetical protein